MKYRIELTKVAETDLKTLLKSDRTLFNKILTKIELLATNPYEGKPLTGNHKGEYSFRLNKYRIVYELSEGESTLYILTVKHRKHVY